MHGIQFCAKCECDTHAARTFATDLFTSLKANFKSISLLNHFLECITVSIIVKVSPLILFFVFFDACPSSPMPRNAFSIMRTCVCVCCHLRHSFTVSHNSATLCDFFLLSFGFSYSSGSRGLRCGISLLCGMWLLLMMIFFWFSSSSSSSFIFIYIFSSAVHPQHAAGVICEYDLKCALYTGHP